MYKKIETKIGTLVFNSESLRLSRSPGIHSWGVFVGMLSLGIGAAYYGSDSLFMKFIYIFGCLIFGCIFLEEWEECVVSRIQDVITLRKWKIFHKLLRLSNENNSVHIRSHDVMNVRVDSKGNTNKYLVLVHKSGITVPIFEAAISGDNSTSDLQWIEDKIKFYLKLSHIECIDKTDQFILQNDSSDVESTASEDDNQNEVIETIHDGRLRESIESFPSD